MTQPEITQEMERDLRLNVGCSCKGPLVIHEQTEFLGFFGAVQYNIEHEPACPFLQRINAAWN